MNTVLTNSLLRGSEHFFSVFSTKSKAFHGELELELQLRIGIKSLNSSADVWKHCQTVILCMVHGSF